MLNKYFWLGVSVWGFFAFILFCLREKSPLHHVTIEKSFSRGRKVLLLSLLAATIILCVFPMTLTPIWNGEIPDHRNQYELMAEAILDGHLYIDYGEVDPLLLTMENPYDRAARESLGVDYHWDHAFYNGRYYMYFGVVPVFLLFLPYRVITGMALTTYHATQIFVALFICGVFATFYELAKKFFPQITLGIYLSLSSAFAIMSVYYSSGKPALYSTAITAGLCVQIWSIFFFIRAVWVEENQKKSIMYAFFGSLLGALTFGCRPPIALANILVIPMLIEYLKKRAKNGKLIKQLIFAASPYVVIGILLMVYNYARFENPFEFGQSYQLTVADQRNYGDFFSQFSLIKELNGILFNFINYNPLSKTFPYISYNGTLVNFPILCFSIIGLAQEAIREKIKEIHLGFLMKVLFLLPLIITMIDVLWTPTIAERTQMDILWVMGLCTFIVIAFWYMNMSAERKAKFSHRVTLWALATVCMCIVLFIAPTQSSYTTYFPERLYQFKYVITFGLGRR